MEPKMSAMDMVQSELKVALHAWFAVSTEDQMSHVMSAGAKSVAA